MNHKSKINIGAFSLFIIILIAMGLRDIYAQGIWVDSKFSYSYRKNDFYIKDLENYQIGEARLRFGLTFVRIDSLKKLQSYVFGIPIYNFARNDWYKIRSN